MTEPIIEIKALSKTYRQGDNDIVGIHPVDLQFAKGTIVALMGPSGSGKSTLLNLLGVLDQPSAGTIVMHGHETVPMNAIEQAHFRNETLGFVFQNFNLIPVLTALENVMLAAQLGNKLDDATIETKASALLRTVGLEQQTHQKVNRLSGGQMQRVAIARALVNDPEIVLADEPTANLDHDTAATVLGTLRKLAKEKSVTVIIATHDQSVLSYCDRIITMRDGRLVSDEAAQDRVQ